MLRLLLSIFILLLSHERAHSQRATCIRSSCYPATGDLLIGRESQLTATSTCGLSSPEAYCILSYLVERNRSAPLTQPLKTQQCFVCDSTKPYFPAFSPNSHRIENVVAKIPRDRNRWWQSVNGQHNVSIQLNLEAEFHFTHLIMTFKTFRPAAMYIERSFDFGRSWRPYRYYSSNCLSDFPDVSRGPMRKIGDVICSSEYTDMEPSTGGEVIFRAVPSHLQKIDDPYSEEVQELVKLTNLRIVFTRLHTLGDLAFDSRPEVINNYYYALFEFNVRGSCSCYGHAERCVPSDPSEAIDNMVYGMCECTHHTTGMNCHKCKPFYNDLPWKPATIESSNECKKCECNQHATRCHFDAAVFKASGGVSGGVCDDCADNTQGKNCQECRPFFYQDDTLPLSDKNICKPCNCDPFGSENRGECEQRTDVAAKTVAGRCICKKYAGGPRCDRCKPGYWNFTSENPEACQKCKCYLPGTFRNQGCNQRDGRCTCKRFVRGERCDECLPGYYGLAASVEEGCKPCNCDPGGSASPYCEPISGTCPCKEGMEGRRCNKVKPGYFVPRIDVLIYEVEDKKSGGSGRVVELPANVTGRGPRTHTGRGVVELGPKDTVDITIRPTPPPGQYEVAIRVQPKEFGGKGWPQIRVTVIRPGPPDPNSLCGRLGAREVESFLVDLNATAGAIFIPRPVCIGPNETIIIRITPNDRTKPSPNAKILVDSVVLVPGPINNILKPPPGSTKDYREDWQYCRDLILSLLPTQLPERCKKFKTTISVSVFGRASKCECSKTGSKSNICDEVGGQCQCKPGVRGRNCDECRVNHYGFGPSGCKPCFCDPRGSTHPQCHPVTGKCPCIANAYGRTCNECKRGFWNYPGCRPCQCNLHTDTCDSLTGKCLNCTDYTDGDRCDRCRPGYYGDPRQGVNIPCKPCLCPGGLDSGFDRSVGCVLDPTTNRAKCLCKKGYAGGRCERCDTNYYGNPLDPKSKCRPCDCNNNIDRKVPNSCDSTTGTCLKCLHNTMGSNCQDCMDGFYGNATERQCKKCICFEPGTRKDSAPCDRKSGQCPCLPNVEGRSCDRCAPNYWNLTSRRGCQKCDCDAEGSIGPDCNLLSGQCKCKPRRGGRRCNECPDKFWGYPLSKEGCKECKCVPEGSKSLQCDRRTGQCPCKPGVAGYNCDRCDRGTRGRFPKCVPCGECWIRWYRIIDELLNKTKEFKKNAGKITGAVNLPKNYADDLNQMERQLRDIDQLLKGKNITSSDVQRLQQQLKMIRDVLKSKEMGKDAMANTKRKLEDSTRSEKRLKAVQQTLEEELKKLKEQVDKLTSEAIEIKDSNLAGAFATVEENKKKSDEARKKLTELDDERKKVKDEMDSTRERLRKEKDSLARTLDELRTRSDRLASAVRRLKEEALPRVNKKVCGGPWEIPYTRDPVCHPSCGGGGCPYGKCGGASVCRGARDNMRTAQGHLDATKKLLEEKTKAMQDLQDKIKTLTTASAEAEKKAEEARLEATKVANQSSIQDSAVKSLLKKMQDFLDSKPTRRSDLEKLLKEITDTKAPITDAEIDKLKKEIQDRVNKLKNVDKILRETKNDRELAEKLQKDADDAKKSAEELMKKAEEISKALGDAQQAQKDASGEVDKLKASIDQMNSILSMITMLNDRTAKTNAETNEALKQVNKRMDELENSLRDTKTTVDQIEKENAENKKKTDAVEKGIREKLQPKVKEATAKMGEKERLVGVLSSRGKKLRDRINTVATGLKDKLKRLEEAEKKKRVSQVLLDSVEKNVNKMMTELMDIYGRTRQLVNRHELC